MSLHSSKTNDSTLEYINVTNAHTNERYVYCISNNEKLVPFVISVTAALFKTL